MILHLVTDRRRLSPPDASEKARLACLLEQIRHASAAGIDVVQIREADLDDRDLTELVRSALAIASKSKTRIIVNDRVDVALAAGAAGVHLKAASVPPAAVRRIVPEGFVVGQSVHSVAEAKGAADSVDYVIAGTVWPSASKSTAHPCIGTDGLSAIVRALSVPTLAIGGVSVDRIQAVAISGAQGIAAIGLFMTPASDSGVLCRAGALERVARETRQTFDRRLSPS